MVVIILNAMTVGNFNSSESESGVWYSGKTDRFDNKCKHTNIRK